MVKNRSRWHFSVVKAASNRHPRSILDWEATRMIFRALVCLCVILASGTVAEAASARPHVVIAHAAMNFRVAPLWVAQDQGFFTKYGIDSEIVFMRGGPTLLSGMMSGDIQIG